jgi:hypothetical protein
MRNRKKEVAYSLLGDTSQTLYNAYKSNTGKIVQGALEGGLGTTIAAMSSVADNEMLGIHTALGGIWVALTAKNFAEAGNEYLNKREEDIENLGIEILTYAKLRARDFRGVERSFIATVNSELVEAISDSLTKNNSPELSADEIEEIGQAMTSRENFEALTRKRSTMTNAKILTATAAIGALGVTGGVVAMAAAGSNVAAFNAGIASAGAGTALTSISGGLLNAGAANSRSISSGIFERIEMLNETKFGLSREDLKQTRSEIRKEEFTKKQPSTSTRSRDGRATAIAVSEAVELTSV